MDDGEFWELIDLLDGVAGRASVARLTAALGDRAEEFRERIGVAVRDIDTDRVVADVPLDGDARQVFLLGVVAAGRDVYESVRADPASAAGRAWDFERAELLSLVAAENDGPGWCRPQVSLSSMSGVAYADALYDIAADMGGRADWREWWAAAGREFLDLHVEQDDAGSGRIRRGRRVVRAGYRLPMRKRGGAAQDMARIMGEVAAELNMPEPPAVPVPARLKPGRPGDR